MSNARPNPLALAILPLAACAAAPIGPRALSFRSTFDAACRGGVGLADFRAPEPVAPSEPAPDAAWVDIAVRTERVSWDDAGALFGGGFTGTAAGAASAVDARGEVARLFAKADGDKGQARLMLCEGQRGTWSRVHQHAYVSGYRFESREGAAWIAGPTVSVVDEGVWFELAARCAAGAWQLEVDLTWADAEEPAPQREVTLLAGAGALAELEQPLLHHASLETTAELCPGEALVLAAPLTGPRGGVLVAVVEPLTAHPSDAGASGAP